MKLRKMELLDTQYMTDHLKTLGGIEIPQEEYLELLLKALR
jgi:Leu/Phe-tRNA-protein transferase